MTSVTGTTAAGQATAYNSLMSGQGVATDKTSLGNKDFLQLLIKQLQNQDPSSPMDSNAIMQQTATLSSTQTMQQMIDVQQEQFALQMRVSASGFVGQTVSYTDSAGKTQSGLVTGATFAAGTPTLTIGGASVALDAVSGITKAASSSAAATPAATTGSSTTGSSTTPTSTTTPSASGTSGTSGTSTTSSSGASSAS